MKKFLALLLAMTLMFAMAVPAYAAGINESVGKVIDYGWVIFAAVVCAVVIVIAVLKFIRTPRPEQMKKVKAWLLLAVMKAEKKFGEDTGVLKLRAVYDLFVTKFPWLAQLLTFDRFAELVDEALEEMKVLLAENPALIDEVDKM
ncbi:MAG: hypothetical protein IJ364_01145 [Oscillospiraceae bacterium]|nr:hypothetical protein [Oscillospiraceae bacterium]